jgi:hypothetical protein
MRNSESMFDCVKFPSARLAALFCCVLAAVVITVAGSTAAAQKEPPQVKVTEQPKGKSFRMPRAAAAALYGAARRDDETELLSILGPDAKDILMWSDNPEERKERRTEFADRYRQMHRLVKEPDGTVAIYVGSENWPFPIPIVEYNGSWYFDAELGRQEILYRRIGRNEMESLEVCHALVDAEKNYYNGAHQYTANFVSTGESHNGLYWNGGENGQKSPIGPYLAHAGIADGASQNPVPYHGYYYRIFLTSSSSNGAGPFAVVAFPANYRSSGVKTFIMDENGTAYEKDLGASTEQTAKQITSYPPDDGWEKVE